MAQVDTLKDITLHFSSDAQSVLKGLHLRPQTETHIIVGSLETEDKLIKAIPKSCTEKELQALLDADTSLKWGYDIVVPITNNANHCSGSLEKISAKYLSSGSVSAIIDLSGLWYTTSQAGDDRMREMLLSFLAPNAVLYTTFAPIFNSWSRLIAGNDKAQEFVDTKLKFRSERERMRIYKVPIRRALELSLQASGEKDIE